MTQERNGLARVAGLATRNVTLAGCAALCVMGATVSADGKATYTTIDVPGSAWTQADSINDNGTITGTYPCGGSVTGGFVRTAGGSFKTFSAYPCTGQSANETDPDSIDAKGEITGSVSARGTFGGFVRNMHGKIKSIVLGPALTNDSAIRPTGINDNGFVTGFVDYSGEGRDKGFVRAPGGRVVIFTPPGSIATYPLSINDSGAIAGYYEDSDSHMHGFVRAADGTIASFDPPGSAGTRAIAISDAGEITGDYNDSNEIDHGFVRAVDGTITSFIAFGTTQMTPMSINSKGWVTGSYTANIRFHGFVRAPDGTITSFDPPGSTLTYPLAINNTGAITGYYSDRRGTYHGFLRTR
ncbi:MAG: hypothetical protein ACREHF_13590 [Rhizomicrobium sp.]